MAKHQCKDDTVNANGVGEQQRRVGKQGLKSHRELQLFSKQTQIIGPVFTLFSRFCVFPADKRIPNSSNVAVEVTPPMNGVAAAANKVPD